MRARFSTNFPDYICHFLRIFQLTANHMAIIKVVKFSRSLCLSVEALRTLQNRLLLCFAAPVVLTMLSLIQVLHDVGSLQSAQIEFLSLLEEQSNSSAELLSTLHRLLTAQSAVVSTTQVTTGVQARVLWLWMLSLWIGNGALWSLKFLRVERWSFVPNVVLVVATAVILFLEQEQGHAVDIAVYSNLTVSGASEIARNSSTVFESSQMSIGELGWTVMALNVGSGAYFFGSSVFIRCFFLVAYSLLMRCFL
jgi:hypothetical protein